MAQEHKMVKPESESQENLLKALLEQQVADHGYLQHMAEALQTLYLDFETEKVKRATSEAEAAQMDLGLRREMYAIREKLTEGVAEELTKVQELFANNFKDGPGKIIADKYQIMEKRIEDLNKSTDELQQYIKGLQADRPLEGIAIQELVNAEVGQVKELVKRFEVQVVPNAGGFTREVQ